ncbi:MAG: hypothetical protein IPQ02_12780 [Saprospiraceae bacterium]|nr:hypothetical protein [Candidatus Defluviibacterium haderslevense]
MKNVSIFDLDPNNFQCPEETISVFGNDVDNALTPISRLKKIIKSLNKRNE